MYMHWQYLVAHFSLTLHHSPFLDSWCTAFIFLLFLSISITQLHSSVINGQYCMLNLSWPVINQCFGVGLWMFGAGTPGIVGRCLLIWNMNILTPCLLTT